MKQAGSFFLVLMLMAASITLTACDRPIDGNRATLPADTLYRVSSDELRSLDPQKVSTIDDVRVLLDLFEGLTRYNAKGEIEPGLADHWTINANGKLWTFYLRDRLQFSDGSPLTSHDIVATFQRLLAPATAAPNASLMYALENAEAVASGSLPVSRLGVAAKGPHIVEFRLTKPLPAFAELLAHASAAILPGRLIQAHPDTWIKHRPLVSSGAFRLVNWRLQNALTMEKNPYYHENQNTPLKRVIYLPLSDDQTALRRFRAGEVDIVPDFPARQFAFLKRAVPENVHTAPYRGSYYFVFNTRRPPFNDVRVRQALSMAVDRDILVKQVLGLNQPQAYSVVPPDLAGYGPAFVPAYAQWPYVLRLAQAKRLLAQAGYTPHHPLIFDLSYNSDTDHRRVALALSQMWKPLGITTRTMTAEASVHFAALKSGDFSLARSGWIADYAGAENFLSIYQSNAGQLNYTGYHNPDFDHQMEHALAEHTPFKRNQALRAAEALLMADMPVLPLYFYVSSSLVSKNVHGWTDNLANMHPSRTLWVERPSPVRSQEAP